MTGGSQQLRRFRSATRAGHPVEQAARTAGVSMAEARDIIADDVKDPPAPDAYRPLGAAFCATCAGVLCSCPDAGWLDAPLRLLSNAHEGAMR